MKNYFIGGSLGLARTAVKDEYKDSIKNKYFSSGGPGYFISYGLLKKIQNDIFNFLSDWQYFNENIAISDVSGACDYAFSYFLSKYYDIEVLFHDGFYHLQPYRYPHDTKEVGIIYLIDKPIAYHSLNIREMNILYELLLH